MSTSLGTRAAAGGREAAERLRVALWPIMQTAAAAGLAWYLTHDVLAHPQPFFAPISAVVCMSATNVLRARRAAQMIVGVALGIVVGGVVEAFLGSGWPAFTVAVFLALGFAVLFGRGFIGQGLMFVNQTGVSAILVLVFAHSAGLVAERLFDALIGGGLAFVFSILLFPANPVTVLTAARASVLAALHDTLVQIALVINDPEQADPEWPLTCVDRLHNQLGGLIEARSTARLIVRRAPLRAAMRDTIAAVDHHAARLGLLASTVLQLARTITLPVEDSMAGPLHAAVGELAQAVSAADMDPAAACAHLDVARGQAFGLESAARDRAEVVLAEIVRTCVGDLQEVIDCPGW
ncbi:FUSC family protein [Mycobacterium sp.]|uniref:FUSC family protein n=1 Tax=Mycobacterium sp. TaxID=1785 RepID=UPI000CC11A74|nr:FUSC family protein [Mycobacterium sp.]PJE13483.1 MAG: hypothetical protein CK428_10280 [Mycobacterium sp.]